MIYGTHDNIRDMMRHVSSAVAKLAPHLNKFDSIAVRGTSGLLIGPTVALQLGKPLVIVRKDTETAHSSSLVEQIGDMGHRVLFLDDFISTGDTRRAVLDAISFRSNERADLVGQYLYQGYDEETHEYTGTVTFFQASLKKPQL